MEIVWQCRELRHAFRHRCFESGYRPKKFGQMTQSAIWNLLWEINEHNVSHLQWRVILVEDTSRKQCGQVTPYQPSFEIFTYQAPGYTYEFFSANLMVQIFWAKSGGSELIFYILYELSISMIAVRERSQLSQDFCVPPETMCSVRHMLLSRHESMEFLG